MNVAELQTRLNALKPTLAIDAERARLVSLKQEAANPNLWDDQEHAVQIMADVASVEKLLAEWDTVEGLLELGDSLNEADISQLEADIRALELQALLSGEHDAESALLSIHAGTGGTDAQDWAEILERMFLRYIDQGKTESPEDRTLGIDRSNWVATVLDRSAGEEAGIKTSVIQIKGHFAFGLLKGEAGVHRLVRLSPFNSKNLRQTSFALVEVIPQLDKPKNVQINEQDLQTDVFRSGGAGGQHVNTTDSAVRITHKPTGIVIVVQNERSQHQNKATALTILTSKLARLSELKSAEELAMLKGEFREGTWGNQIRSYVMQPYQLVKDHRTESETSNIQSVLDGELKQFIEAERIQNK